MRIWITGICGFLGGHLADELTALGHEVEGNDNLLCSSLPLVKAEHVDCRNLNSMKSLMMLQRTEVLIHCAATAHEGLSNFSPSFITRNIYEASVATFSAAIAAGVKRIVNMSSMARYGGEMTPFSEVDTPRPIDPYGIAKVAAEQTLKALCELHGVEYVIAVPHNIIGPRQRYNDPYRNVASIMINRALQNKPLIVYGDGLQKRSFSPIKDCLHSLIQMIDAPIGGEVINIGPAHGTMTILDLAKMVRHVTDNMVDIIHVDERPNEVKEAYCTSDKAERLLGYKPQQSIEDCLVEMVNYIKAQGTKEFSYSFPIEIINEKTPKTWVEKLI